MRVDAHHHVWTLARGDYRWLSPDLPIARDYGLDDLRPLLGDITATVLVQAADSEAETAFMLDVARGSAGLVRGVVGWTNLASPGAPARIAELAADPLLKGLRPMLQDIDDTAWILRPAVQLALAAMLHLFANDAWMTAANNSGVLTMEIVRLPAKEPILEPIWTLAQRVHRSKRRSGATPWATAYLQPLQWSRSA